MQVALIPPYSQLHLLEDRKYHMILPECLKSEAYIKYVRTMTPGSYRILDNGMFESGGPIDNEGLIDLAIEYAVMEIVMPDVRGDMGATLDAVHQFLNLYEGLGSSTSFHLMIVLQVAEEGQIPEFIRHAQGLEATHFGEENVFTYGIPRRMVDQFGPAARINAVDWIGNLTRSKVHLLGYARTGLHPRTFNEVQELSCRDCVRGIDTEAPWVWAADGALLAIDGDRHERQLGYFGMLNHAFSASTVEANIDTLNRWANGHS